MNLQLPKGLSLLETQVAGHTFSQDAKALGMLKNEREGCVLKPMGKPECGERELSFYQSLHNANDPLLLKARKFVPTFYEKIQVTVNSRECTFLKLEDLSHGFKQPCIMDIKVGKRTWDPLASPNKRNVEEQKYVGSKQVLGLCLPGFQMYTKSGEIERWGKDYGKRLTDSGFRETIVKFLNAEQNACRGPLLQEILKQLNYIKEWFNEQRLYHFYASSLLIVYDYDILNSLQSYNKHCNGILNTNGNGNAQHTHSNDHTKNMKSEHQIDWSRFIKVRMIDFAHVFPATDGQLDANYIFGLQNLINIIEDIIVLPCNTKSS